MYRGAAYAASLQYQHCIDLWKYALELRVAKDSILFCDTCFTAQVIPNGTYIYQNGKHEQLTTWHHILIGVHVNMYRRSHINGAYKTIKEYKRETGSKSVQGHL